MAEAAATYDNPELAKLRLLTEVEHFLEYIDTNGEVPSEVFEAVVQNRTTASQEIAMPYAVTKTEHEVVERVVESGERRRVIMWLGRTALDVASSGYEFHFSEPAYKRTSVEEAEAVFTEGNLRAGVAQVMISPKMTRHDASEALAKAEHLHDDDAIRTSTAIKDEHGAVVGRRLQSLLVRHIPFEAWVHMLKDADNIFGRSFPLGDELSAVSVMELFSQMELPEDKLPEGPVTLVEGVLPYIDDDLARQKVMRQLKRFRSDQELYKHEAEIAGREWALFDLELARSLQQHQASDSLRFFIMQNADAWNDEALAVIEACELGNTHYAMTDELAALLSRAKQKLVGDELSVATDNDRATEHASAEALREIKALHQEILYARETGVDPVHVRMLEQRQSQMLHQQPIRSGGGCTGDAQNAFGPNGEQLGVGETDSPFGTSAENKASWKWKQGVCQVKACPSPKPTEVGPCSVCRRCQHEFDRGHDPTKASSRPASVPRRAGAAALFAKPKGPANNVPKKEVRATAV